MPKSRTIQNNFTSGFVDDDLVGRIDLQQYQNGLKQAQNVLTLPQGPVKRRPGTSFVDELPNIFSQNLTVPTMPNGGTATNINDNNPATTATTTAGISTTNPYVVAEYDLGAETEVMFVDVIGIKLSAPATSTEFVIEHSSNGSTWTTLSTISSLTDTAQDIRAEGVTARYFRIARVGSANLGTNTIIIGDFLIWDKGALSKVRLFDFELTDDDTYLLAFTYKNLRI